MLRFVEAVEQCCECGVLLHTCCSLWQHAFLPDGRDEIICGECAMELEEEGKGVVAKIVSKFPDEDAKYDKLPDAEVFLYNEFLEEQTKKGNVVERE